MMKFSKHQNYTSIPHSQIDAPKGNKMQLNRLAKLTLKSCNFESNFLNRILLKSAGTFNSLITYPKRRVRIVNDRKVPIAISSSLKVGIKHL